jgi:acylphosphatase
MRTGYRITLSGKVQNVGFRYYTMQAARDFNINGFVKNQLNGTVYIEAEGEAGDLEGFMSWCRRGPQWARVDGFDLQEQPVMGYSSFAVK